MRKTMEMTEETKTVFEERLGRIKSVLKARTQVELAEAIGVRQSSISDAKRRCSIPSDWLLTIWAKTGYSPAWIMEGDVCGHRFAVAAMEAGELVNAVEIRKQVEADVRAEVDNLGVGELIERLRSKMPDVQIVIGGCGAFEFQPCGDSIFTQSCEISSGV